MINRFYVFGNIGKLSEVPKSGGQSSARRVIHGLEKNGYEVEPIVRHRCELEGRLLHFIETQTFAIIDLFKILAHISFGKRKTSAFLVLTYGGKLAPYELIITLVVRMMGYKSITYMKGGQFMDFYNRGSKFYHWIVKKNMDLQEQVWFEGLPSLEIVKKITSTHLVYFPNYITEDNIPCNAPVKPVGELNLCYFGRVTPDKKVDVIIKTFEILSKRYNNVHLTIIGGSGYSESYVREIDAMIENSPYSNHITRKGLTPFEEIKKILQSQHMFIFPSKERAEGHSNSLNEAMAQGLVPVVSNYHFNRDIVGDDRLIVEGWEPEAYADKIDWILHNCNLKDLSEKMWQRVKDNFTYDIVNNRLSQELKTI